jgi:hypothetical protein
MGRRESGQNIHGGVEQKPAESSEELGGKEHLDPEMVAKKILGALSPKNFRQEILDDIPTEEGKRVFEEMLKEQMGIFENILRGKITGEALDLRTAEHLIDVDDPQFREYLAEQLNLRQKNFKNLKKEFQRLLKYKRGQVEELGEEDNEVGARRSDLATYLYRRKQVAEPKEDREEDRFFVEARNKAEEELISEEVRKILVMKELVTHHLAGFDPTRKKWNLGHYSDIDGSGAIGLLGAAGINIQEGKYVPAGETERGAANFDTGNQDGLNFEYGDPKEEEQIRQELERLGERSDILLNEYEVMPEGEEKEAKREEIERIEDEWAEKKKELKKLEKTETVIFDHHGSYSHRDTSTTKVVYEVLKRFGLLKFEDEKEEEAYERLVDFITRMDNARFEEYNQKDFEQSNRTILGLNRWLTFEKLLEFFKEGKTETDILSPQELQRCGLKRSFSRGGESVKIDRSEQQSANIERALERIRELERNGWVFSDQEGNKFLIDLNGEAGTLGPWGSAAKGYRGIIRYSPGRNGFSVMFNGEYNLKKFEDLPQGLGVRGGMFFLPMDREKLIVNLDDIIARIAPNFVPQKESELEKFLNGEGRVIKATITRSPDGKFWWTRNLRGDAIILEKAPPKEVESGDEIYIKIVNPRKGKRKAARNQENYPKEYYLGEYESGKIEKGGSQNGN